MPGPTEVFFALLPMIIGLVVAIFVVVLFARLVRAVEQIADNLEKK